MKKDILIIAFVLVVLYFLLKQYTTQVSSSVNQVPTGKGTTISSNPLTDMISGWFKPVASSTVFKGVAAQPTLQQLGVLQRKPFDYSYCGVSKRVIDPSSGVLVNFCIDAATGDAYSLDQFPSGNVPFRILSDPNQIRLSEDMNGLTSNAYNNDNTASNSPMKNLGIDPLTVELTTS